MTLKNNRAPLLCYFTLCASFHSHQLIQTGVSVWKRPIWVKIDFFSRVTLKFDRWPWKNRALLLTYFKLYPFVNSNWCYSPETLNSVRNCIYFSRVTLKFDGWLWKTIGSSSILHQALVIVEESVTANADGRYLMCFLCKCSKRIPLGPAPNFPFFNVPSATVPRSL